MRPWQYYEEAAAYWLLEINLPASWILRRMEERDYGWDCLLEIIDMEGPLMDQSAWIQLNTGNRIRWNRGGRYRMGDLKNTSSWYAGINSGPVFTVLVDLKCSELFFICVEHYIKKHFAAYLRRGNYAFYFDKNHDRLDTEEGVQLFAWHLEEQAARRQLENEVTIFLTDLSLTTGTVNTSGDAGQYLLNKQRNYNFLCDHFQVENEKEILSSIASLLKGAWRYWSMTRPATYYYMYSLAQRQLTVR